MKKILIIVGIVVIILVILDIFVAPNIPGGTSKLKKLFESKNDKGTKVAIKNGSCASVKLAAAPSGKKWVCVNDNWILQDDQNSFPMVGGTVNKNIPTLYFYRNPGGGCMNNGYPQSEQSCLNAGI